MIDGGREGSGGLGPAHETDARSSFQYFYQSFIDTLARLDPIKTLLFCELCSPFILQLARNLYYVSLKKKKKNHSVMEIIWVAFAHELH